MMIPPAIDRLHDAIEQVEDQIGIVPDSYSIRVTRGSKYVHVTVTDHEKGAVYRGVGRTLRAACVGVLEEMEER